MNILDVVKIFAFLAIPTLIGAFFLRSIARSEINRHWKYGEVGLTFLLASLAIVGVVAIADHISPTPTDDDGFVPPTKFICILLLSVLILLACIGLRHRTTFVEASLVSFLFVFAIILVIVVAVVASMLFAGAFL